MSEFKVMNNDEIRDFCIKKDLKIYELSEELNETYNSRTKLRNQLQQKENIIKEVREYIDRRDIEWGSEEHNHVLKILEKGE